MIRLICMFLACICTSFYFFPFYFTFLPAINTKMALAVCGFVVLGYRLAKGYSSACIDKSILVLSYWAFAISLISFFTMTLNATRDSSFVTYFISMWVWLGGAYMVICIIKWIHGYAGVHIVANYMIAVCTIQCILAVIFQFCPEIDETVSNIIGGNEAFMGTNTGDRLHGIGCALDVAGLKFATILCFIGYFISCIRDKRYWREFILYLFCFIIITVIGNMISRSAIIGVGLVVVYWFFVSIFKATKILPVIKSFTVFILCIPIVVALYNSSPVIKKNIRFGFEGFFSLAETGKWYTGSNDILRNMIVFPNNFKTWIIGDGYAANPSDKRSKWFDEYYTGPSFHGFYMQTDIGYCRYIFYFGIIGLGLFMGYFFYIYTILKDRYPQWKMIFLAILVVNFIGWTKVSTDLFVIFAPFLCLSIEEKEEKAVFYTLF